VSAAISYPSTTPNSSISLDSIAAEWAVQVRGAQQVLPVLVVRKESPDPPAPKGPPDSRVRLVSAPPVPPDSSGPLDRLADPSGPPVPQEPLAHLGDQ
jgi:hypothetical protein